MSGGHLSKELWAREVLLSFGGGGGGVRGVAFFFKDMQFFFFKAPI